MEADQAVQFACDWPPIRGLPAVCNFCNQPVWGNRRKVIKHLNEKHPGWLEMWNNALKENGIG